MILRDTEQVLRLRQRLGALAAGLTLLLALASGASAEAGLSSLLAAVEQHPGLRAANAAADAAALRADAVRAPFSLNVEVSLQRLQVEPASDPLPDPFDTLFDIDSATERATISALLRPLLVGDLRDLFDQRQLELERAELTVRETRATLETQALRAAAGLLLAERGEALAGDALALSQAALSAAQLRFERGAASDFDLRRAELQVGDAERGLARAQRQRAAAEAALEQLVGAARLAEIPELEPVLAAPPDLIRAVIDLSLAEIGARNQSRALAPTVQAGYTWIGDDGDTLTLGLESRTLQPSLSYTPNTSGLSNDSDDPLAGTAPTVRGSFNLAIAWSISPQAALGREASTRQVAAAAAALEAAHDRAALQLRAERDALADAERGLALAELERALAIDETAAAAQRYAAGLISALERDQAQLALAQAELGWWSARVELLGAILDTYAAYAIPLSEVVP